MKKNIYINILTYMALVMSSCSDFLSTLPDNRTEINNAEKVTNLLVSAYPESHPLMLWEMSSDNVMDNGAIYDVLYQSTEDAYLWKDIVDIDNDAPMLIWDNCYAAIASANQALASIEEMGSPESLNPQKGEALLCRAYAHFVLVNTFCEAYDPQTAEHKLGIPYAKQPETTVSPVYKRGTLAETYKNIEADIEEGLPLIDDNIYKVPKYHFNKKASYAFAARFYLFNVKEDKSNYEKVIEYANKVLGNNPSKVLRNYYDELGKFTSPVNMANAYVDAKSSANLLICSVVSNWPVIYGLYDVSKRYGMSMMLAEQETMISSGVWGEYKNIIMGSMLYGFNEKLSFYKYDLYQEYIDKVNGLAYPRAVFVPFTTNETILCRAEAYAMKSQPDFASATRDINLWMHSAEVVQLDDLSENEIDSYFERIPYTPVVVKDVKERTIKKYLNPPYPLLNKKQENFIHCILQMRRMECLHDGMRWLDIKRWGIEISHNRDGKDPDVLYLDDPRRAIQLPFDVIDAGLTANPRN